MAKGKSNRRRGAAPGVDPNVQRRERLEARRQAKATALAAQRKKEQRETLVKRIGMVLLAGALIWFLFLRTAGPTEFNGHPVEELSQAGLGQHLPPETEANTVEYESSPPVSGQHFAQQPVCGTFASPIANEAQVHALEHGAVGVQFQATVDPEQVDQLEEIAKSYDDRVFSGPYPMMDTPIAVTSWGRLMELDTVDETAIRAYIEEFRGKGPEDQPCPGSSSQTFEPNPTTSPSPGASPSVSASPSPGKKGKKASPSPSG